MEISFNIFILSLTHSVFFEFSFNVSFYTFMYYIEGIISNNKKAKRKTVRNEKKKKNNVNEYKFDKLD